MFTPQNLLFDHVGSVESFKISLYRASDNSHIHGVQLAAAGITKVDNTYTVPLAIQGFVPNGSTIPDHEDLYFKVQAIVGIDSSANVQGSNFQFTVLVSDPFNLNLS